MSFRILHDNNRLRSALFEPPRLKSYLRIYAPSEDSDQPAHSRSLIRIFRGHFLDSQGCNVSLRGHRILWSDCTSAQAELRLRWTLRSEGTFSHVAVHFCINFAPLQTISLKFDALESRILRCCLFVNLQAFHAWLGIGDYSFFSELYYVIGFKDE